MEVIPFFASHPLVSAYFTTRQGGVSQGYNDSLNLGFMTGDSKENVYRNRQIVKETLGITQCVEVFPQQVHGDQIETVGKVSPNTEHGIYRLGECDGIITKEAKVLLTTGHADCLAVFLYDPKNHVIGLCHAGWRGTQKQIAVKTASAMVEQLGAEPEHILAAISPGISLCCFEVGEEVYTLFAEDIPQMERFSQRKDNGKYHLDLKGINQFQLAQWGISSCEVSSLCTCCHTDTFFSYRGEQGKTGRMCAGITMLS